MNAKFGRSAKRSHRSAEEWTHLCFRRPAKLTDRSYSERHAWGNTSEICYGKISNPTAFSYLEYSESSSHSTRGPTDRTSRDPESTKMLLIVLGNFAFQPRFRRKIVVRASKLFPLLIVSEADKHLRDSAQYGARTFRKIFRAMKAFSRAEIPRASARME